MTLEAILDNSFFPGFMTLETIKNKMINLQIIFKIKVNLIGITVNKNSICNFKLFQGFM